MKIFKYQLRIDDVQVVEMPAGSRILSVQAIGNSPSAILAVVSLWALVDDSGVAATVDRKIYIRGTGHDADDVVDAAFVGTVQLAGGALVFHVFDGGEVR